MNTPQIAAQRFLSAVALGIPLGIWYSFLRPLRPKHTFLSDLLFVIGALAAWIQLAFGICLGDIRMAYLMGLGMGVLGWEISFGKWLRGFFCRIWRYIGKMWDLFWLPVKKILKIAKILFASGEKWVTIRWNNRRRKRRKSGGPYNGKHQEPLSEHPNRYPSQQSADQVRGDCGYRTVYGSGHRPALDTECAGS